MYVMWEEKKVVSFEPRQKKLEVMAGSTPCAEGAATHLCGVTGCRRLDSPVTLLLPCLTLGVLPGDVLQGELLLPGEQVIGLLKEGGAGTLLAFTLRGVV